LTYNRQKLDISWTDAKNCRASVGNDHAGQKVVEVGRRGDDHVGDCIDWFAKLKRFPADSHHVPKHLIKKYDRVQSTGILEALPNQRHNFF